MRKIYIVSWNGMRDVGGVERVTRYMYEAWKDTYEVHVLDLEMVRKHRKYGKLLGKHYAIDAVLMSLYTWEIVKNEKERPILVTQGFHAPFLKADIMFAHGTMRGYKVAIEGKYARWHINQWYEAIAMKNAHKVIAVGRHVKREAHTFYHIDKRKIVVLENCVNTERFPCKVLENEGVINVLFSGRLEFMKGLDRLLLLAEKIDRESGMRLLIATPSEENVELFARFHNTKIYQQLSLGEMQHFYQQGDVMFFPSRYEGFEMVTLESLSSGVPVAGNNVGAVSDLYQRGMEGIYLLGEEDDDIDLIRGIALDYISDGRRMRMHNLVEKKYGERQYYERLKMIVGEI